ncbi:proline dehydrogenase 1, mitochondrial isoform X2 [Chelonia mydas]|uniref:proline dehydrogenase 1, mitochondrial isoform X2 n=1 Tax=Chelonia mydas TaxID=8469 RepID=UPI001CA8ECD3|nr:proline dehydrogenase 1, mitochondrial isoform X2 [Chelonia mydas]
MARGVRPLVVRAASSLRSPRATADARQEQPGETPPPPPPPERGSARSETGPRGTPRVQLLPPAVHFGDAREAFRSKRSAELVRALAVLGLCTVEPLVARSLQLMNLSRKLLGQQLFEKLMKMTFYGQFVAGEDQAAIKPLIQRNRAFGVGSVLDYSVEEDLTPEEAARKEMESCTSASEKETGGAAQREKQYRAHREFGDRRDKVISARTYFYADETKCDQHMDTFLRCIEASGSSSEDSFSAIKLTALGRPQFLLQFSEVLMKWRKFFHQMAAEQGKAGLAVVETKLEVKKLQETLSNLGIATKAESQHWFMGEDLGVSGTVDLLDWNSLIDSRTKLSKLLLIPNMKTGQLEPLLSRFTEEEDLQMKRMLQRMDILATRALELGVRLMVDAEQTYFQPAISRLTLEMQRKFNMEKAVVFNTFQCYLKEAYDNVTMDMELSHREGWHFGAKLVRGAYMEQEQARAAQVGYEDLLNPTYEETSEMYKRCLDYVLKEIKYSRKVSMMVASHNEDTVKFVLCRMAELGIHPSEKKVYFGQLLGMCDHITFPLGLAAGALMHLHGGPAGCGTTGKAESSGFFSLACVSSHGIRSHPPQKSPHIFC